MTANRRPATGRRPPRRPSQAVFWRRRLTVLGLLVVLVWGLTRVVGGGDEPSAAQPRTRATATPSATAPAPPQPTATPRTRTRRVVDSQASLTPASASCAPETLAVRPSVPGGAWTGGAVTLRLALTTTARTACTLDVADVDLLVDVARDGDSVWSTQTCTAAVPRSSLQLDPTWATTLDVTWSGRRSGEECAGDEKLLPAGGYRVRAAVLGGEPGEADFALRDRPRPKPTPAPKPAATPAAKPAATPSTR